MKCRNKECDNPKQDLEPNDFPVSNRLANGAITRRKYCKKCAAKNQRTRYDSRMRGFADMSYKDLKDCALDVVKAQKWVLGL